MSILRLNFKTSMTKTISSFDTGQIVLVNGCEVAFISLFAFENDFSIPEALPCLHDKVLEAATDATIVFSENQKKQGNPPGIIGGIIKSLKGGKAENCGDDKNIVAHLERIFSRFPFSDSFTGILDDQEVIVLGIDDIDIDEPVIVTSSSDKSESKGKDKQTERGKLFEGGSTATEPRMRTAEEIRAKYRKEGDASSAAAHARDKLVERQEKLEKLSRHTAELQSGAENFADLAGELVKTMEKRKWWHI